MHFSQHPGLPVIHIYTYLSHLLKTHIVGRILYSISIPSTSIILETVPIDGFPFPRSIFFMVAWPIPAISARSCCDISSVFLRLLITSARLISLLNYTFPANIYNYPLSCKGKYNKIYFYYGTSYFAPANHLTLSASPASQTPSPTSKCRSGAGLEIISSLRRMLMTRQPASFSLALRSVLPVR